jgi:hypothetical protein
VGVGDEAEEVNELHVCVLLVSRCALAAALGPPTGGGEGVRLPLATPHIICVR